MSAWAIESWKVVSRGMYSDLGFRKINLVATYYMDWGRKVYSQEDSLGTNVVARVRNDKGNNRNTENRIQI